MNSRNPARRARRLLARTALLATLLALAAPGAWAQRTDRPNVILVVTDDQGWGDLSLHGNTNLRTPNLDALARGGARFEHFYVQPVCSPTRAEYLTGRYHVRSGVHSTSTGGERLDLDERTVADAFRAAGYATAAFGKWHNGSQYPYHPNARGFDEFYGFASGHWSHYFDWFLEHNGKPVRGQGFISDDLTERAMRFVEAQRGRPFFLYLPYNTPHSPMQVPERFYASFAGRELKMQGGGGGKEDVAHTRAALAMVENTDWNVGRLLAKLDALGLARNTIVVYLHDNGPNGWRWNGGMRGRKGSTDEGGIRSPLFVRWPGKIRPGTTIPQIAGAIDLPPTLADLAGVKLLGDRPLDGLSLRPLLTGAPAGWRDRTIFAHWDGRVSVRSQRYRLDHEGRLYDLTADPGQREDLAPRLPEVAGQLRGEVERFRREVMRPARTERGGRDPRPFPVGYRAFPTTYLPARDGVPHGGVQRSARPPNASFFTGWKSTEGRITWDVEVATPGRYEAVVYYTSRAQGVGSLLELSFRGGSARARVTEPHDPPLVGAKEDRVPREESYDKEFRPLSLGRVTLEAGRGELTLRAPEMPGGEAVDVRAVRLVLLDPER